VQGIKTSIVFWLIASLSLGRSPDNCVPFYASLGAITNEQFAQTLGLQYTTALEPGIVRRQVGRQFAYFDPAGKRVTDPEVLSRIQALGIPPAYRDVRISTNPKAHLQATAVDGDGRRQYRYHADWIGGRGAAKFDHLVDFGKAIGSIRDGVTRDLSLSNVSRNRVMAAAIRLMELSLIRVGNEVYVRENGSFGLTTLRGKHVRVVGNRIFIRFPGKSGVFHDIVVEDAVLAAVIHQTRRGPDDPIFQYMREDGHRAPITSNEINDYVRQLSGAAISAKDFRTWWGTVLAAKALHKLGPASNAQEAKQKIREALSIVANLLGNTPRVSRRSYVHPRVIDAFLDGITLERAFRHVQQRRSRRQWPSRLTLEEEAVFWLIQES